MPFENIQYHFYRWADFTIYAVELDLGAMIFLLHFVNITAIFRQLLAKIHTNAHKQQDDFVILLRSPFYVLHEFGYI